MSKDVNRKTFTKNAWRIVRQRNYTALRVRVPGGHINSQQIAKLAEIAEKYGDGTLHITARQGFEIPNIPMDKVDEINLLITDLIDQLQVKNGVRIDKPGTGYPAAGMRNISACIGSRVCQFANTDTTALAERLEGLMYPNDFHFKIAVTGCPNDCIKAHMQDFGIIAICIPEYDYDQCIGCNACYNACKRKVTGALSIKDGKVTRDDRRCIGCGECVRVCPTFAWQRKPGKFYRMLIMGRTGKKNPRLAMPFLNRVSEDVVKSVIHNTIGYVDRYILRCLAKEHIGYIVDRTGFKTFKEEVLEGVELNPEAMVAKTIQWPGYNTLNDTTFYKITP